MRIKAFIANFLSVSLIFAQTAWAFNDIVPPQNIPDNPIDHIVVDPDRAGDTHLDRAQNGTPVININSASAGGVSANYFRDFNVNDENLILNNLHGEAGVSNLGGALHGNPNFNKPGGRAADIILNEVTSNRVSNISGYTEIFGKQAELIIANPNGIMVGGAGFINTSRLSLVTGKSTGLDVGGNLNPFIISENPNALISVVGRDIYDAQGNPVAYNLGIDMSGGNYVDLLSRVVQINGKLLSSGEINVKTGNDKATKTASGWDVTSTDKSDKPEFAIDSTALGGIYAGRINLIASEDGVGVRTRGDVIANMDDIQYDARGNIVIGGQNSAARDIKISAPKIINENEITAKNNIAIKTDELENTGAQIVAVGDIDLDFGINDWTSSGIIHSGGTLSVAANDFTNTILDFSGKNITINAIGNITNDGKMDAANNLTLTSGGGVVNGLAIGSNAMIHAGGNLSITAETNILNRGFIQALGELSLKTNVTINDDYVLNANSQNLPDESDTNLAPEWQAIYDNLQTETDIVVLSDLLNNIKTPEQYYAVQNRLRIVKIEALLADYAATDQGIDVAEIIALPELELQESLQALLGEDYNPEEWTIDLTNAIGDINLAIDAQQERTDEYNIETEAAEREQYMLENDGDDAGFVYTPVTRAEYAIVAGEDYLDFDTMLADAESVAKDARANQIMQILIVPAQLARDYQLLDWSSLDEDTISINLNELLGEDYNPAEWGITPYVDSSMDLTNAYLNSLRINSINRNLVEKTGIHNDGRIYSGGNMSLISNSVLHNNKGALIFSGGNADFQIKNILFNNENAAGQGIFADGAMSIAGADGAWLSQLINYDGTIESNGDMDIKATEVINYGSDSIDFSQIDNNIYEAHEYRYYYQDCRTIFNMQLCNEKNRVISKAEYDSLKAIGETVTDTFLYFYVIDYPELLAAYIRNTIEIAPPPSIDITVMTHTDSPIVTAVSNTSTLRSNNGSLSILADNVTNYNSQIKGVNIDIRATSLLNTNLTLNVNTLDYYNQRYRACKSRVVGACVDYHHPHRYWTEPGVKTISGTSPSEIIALNDLSIVANKIGNGTFATDDIGVGSYTPLSPIILPETDLQEIVRTGTIDPLANFKLPNGGYGLIRLGDILNGYYLYESDPTLIDLEHYLGSQYFMNRLGIDPNDVESKFMGDAFVEHEIIKKSLEQISSFQNSQMTTEEQDEYINNLYNALTAEKVADLGLEFGRALTPQQIAGLDTDIVWYVRQSITLPNGETVEVLVPQVYLAQSTLDELYGAALARDDVKTSIRGDNVTIDKILAEAEGILNNIGAIVGNRDLVITTDELNNAAQTVGGQRPVLKGGETLVINTGTLDNISGQITGGDVSITADEINNITQTQMESVTQGDYKRTETHIGDTAEISSTGDMNITTTGDVNMAGSVIASGGDMDLNVGGDLNSLAIQDYQYEYERQSSGDMFSSRTTTNISESVTNIGSEISSGGNMSLTTGGDAVFAGTTINAGGDATLDIGGDTTITAVVDYDYDYSNTEKSSWGGLVSEKHIVEDAATRLAGSELNVMDGLTINTGNNLNLIASDVNVGGNADIDAGNDINVLSGTENSKHVDISTKEIAGGFIMSKLTENENQSAHNVKSIINVSGDLNINAENDINVIGGDISAMDGNINAENRLNIFSVQDYDHTYSYSEKTGIDWETFGLQGIVTAVSAIGTIFYPPLGVTTVLSGARMGDLALNDHKRNGSESEKTAIIQVQSNLNFGGTLKTRSENDTTIVSSNINAKNSDSKMETGENSSVVIADLSNITTKQESSAKYSPSIMIEFEYGSDPGSNWNNDNMDWNPYEPERTPTPVDEFIDFISDTIGGLGESIGDSIGGIPGELIRKNTSSNKIEDLILKYPKDWVNDNLESEFNPNLPQESPEPTRLQEYCDAPGCRINNGNIETIETKVESVIQLGEQ